MVAKKRLSYRLRGFDYSSPGYYFITICTFQREYLFGEISEGKMLLNPAGNFAYKCWMEIPQHFPMAILHDWIIMPNHIHGIIQLITEHSFVGAKNFSPLQRNVDPMPFASPSKTIGSIIRGFKIGVTKWFRSHTEIYTPWQRNFHDHIIRNEEQYKKISNYIRHNPENWEDDTFYDNR